MASDFLNKLTIRAGAALEAEDRLIMGSGHVRGEVGGLLRLPNERYYQFILWRAVLSSWAAKVEEERHDLVIFDPEETAKYLVIVEMKKWMSEDGEREIPWIVEDIRRLSSCESPNSALIIFSENPKGDMETNLAWLEERIFPNAPPPKHETYCFPTFSPYNPRDAWEFWIAAWPIRSGSLFLG